MPIPSPITYPAGFLTALGSSPVALGDLVLNTIDADGTVWALEEFPEWEGSAASTLEVNQRARGHGGTSSEPFYQPRTLTMAGKIKARTPQLLNAARDRLNRAVSLHDFTLLVSESGYVRHMTVKRQDEVLSPTVKGFPTLAEFSIQLKADDPLKYGELVTASTLLPSSTGGLVRPSTWPRTWTGVSNTGIIRINNTGNENAPLWLRIDGPIPAGGWSVSHVDHDEVLTFATSLALAAGEFVTVDMENREVLAQGQSPRSGYVTSRGWFSLDPGFNDIAFSAVNHSATALLTATTKPAWS